MIYEQFKPHETLSNLISCYWVVEDENTNVNTQKIIPDGFTEIIFHYRPPYEININGQWELQSENLLAGQLSNHFYLRNTGKSGMVGIKFLPDALTQLFQINMVKILNEVVPLNHIGRVLDPLIEFSNLPISHDQKIAKIDHWFQSFVSEKQITFHPIHKVIQYILQRNGMLKVSELSQQLKVGERQLERLFKHYVGLSPKLFCRIVRFSYIFKLIDSGDQQWTDLSYSAGFFDQSHFIKNFKEFTGEDPSSYGFDEKNMANFFLQDKKS